MTKLNCYEDKYQKIATEAREKEMYHLQKEMAVWALTLVLIVISPMIATAVTFAVYVLIDEGNILTASKSFSVLLLFSALRFPINFAGRLVGSKFIVRDFVFVTPLYPVRNSHSLVIPQQRLRRLTQPLHVSRHFWKEKYAQMTPNSLNA